MQRRRGAVEGGAAYEMLAPVLGFAATRQAHGQDALHMLRRLLCARQETEAHRFVHIALPEPRHDAGEAAPMNWVLNATAGRFMIDSAPWCRFNLDQAGVFAAAIGMPQSSRPPPLAVPECAKPDDPPDGGNDPGASPVIAAAKGRRG
jgi:hypothetical protein